MKAAIVATGCVVLALALPAHAEQGETVRYSQKALLKSWALSRCLGEVNTDAGAKDDANATASALLERGRQPITVYESVGALVSKYASRKYEGSVKSDFNTLKCIDLFNSRELDALAGKLSKMK
jgi:hypothetical protein